MKDTQTVRRVLLGQITGAHGIRGDVLVRSFTADPATIAAYGPLTDASGKRHFTLKIVRVTDKGIVARIKDVGDRNAAEALRGIELYVERARLPEAASSEYYHTDLIGLKALSEDGEDIGEVVGVQNFGAGDLIEIKIRSGGPTEFIPFEDQWVPRVDIAQGLIVIHRPTYGEDKTQVDDGGDVDPKL